MITKQVDNHCYEAKAKTFPENWVSKQSFFCFDVDNSLNNNFCRSKTFLFFKIESWNFRNLFDSPWRDFCELVSVQWEVQLSITTELTKLSLATHSGVINLSHFLMSNCPAQWIGQMPDKLECFSIGILTSTWIFNYGVHHILQYSMFIFIKLWGEPLKNKII